LSQRISAADAAKSVADGIAQRAARTIAPASWQPYSLRQGRRERPDRHRMASDKHVHDLVRKVEERVVSRRVSA
jgi:hypothetical protein